VIALGCAGPTVVHGLLHRMPPRPGEAVVIQGAGPVGLAAAMYAQLAGARPAIVIGAPAQRLELAAKLGVGDERLDIDALDIAARGARRRRGQGRRRSVDGDQLPGLGSRRRAGRRNRSAENRWPEKSRCSPASGPIFR
jgi:threonine dehydrogenase-like Zn-dependent dehydrogenase